MNKFFGENFSKIQRTIVDHVEKADVVPMDLRNLNATNQSKVLGFVNSLDKDQKSRVVIIK